MLGRAQAHRRGRNHTRESLRRKCTPLVLAAIAAVVLVLVFFSTGLSSGSTAGGNEQENPDFEQPKHRFLEGHGLLPQNEAEEPEKYFSNKVSPQPEAEPESPPAKPKLGFYFQKDIPEHLLGSNAPAGLLPQLQKVAKHKAAEGRGGKMGFYFAHDIPEEIKASADDSTSAASLQQVQGVSSSGQKPQQLFSAATRHLQSPQQQASSQAASRKQQQSADAQEAGSSTQSRQQSTTMLQTASDAEHEAVSAGASSAQSGGTAKTQFQKSARPERDKPPDGLSSGAAVHRRISQATGLRPPLGYYFNVPENVKAANTPLFRESQVPGRKEVATEEASSKRPLGYYFSNDISDTARRKNNSRARLLHSHLQPVAVHVQPF